jgi:hypothetical protein
MKVSKQEFDRLVAPLLPEPTSVNTACGVNCYMVTDTPDKLLALRKQLTDAVKLFSGGDPTFGFFPVTQKTG